MQLQRYETFLTRYVFETVLKIMYNCKLKNILVRAWEIETHVSVVICLTDLGRSSMILAAKRPVFFLN